MGYYEQKKKELEELLSLLKREKEVFQGAAEEERARLDGQATRNQQFREGVDQLAKERQVGFPWLARAYDEMFKLEEYEITNLLRKKKHSALTAAKVVKEQSRLRRQAEREKKIAQYVVEYYENIAPFLVDLKEEVGIPSQEERELLRDFSEQELHDAATRQLSKEEYRKLASVERNQLALDRFWSRPKSKWIIGRLYERYIGYLLEDQGYDVEYVGIFKGFEDLGRDLICKKGREVVVIQCKNWSKFRTIYEKHIFQFFGTVFKYKDDNQDLEVQGVFYTSTQLSDLARRFATELKIELKENVKFDKNYPSIKCNVSRVDGSRIYHLPFDQQYDTTKVERPRGEFYCRTVKEAEDAGFRRAFRHRKTATLGG